MSDVRPALVGDLRRSRAVTAVQRTSCRPPVCRKRKASIRCTPSSAEAACSCSLTSSRARRASSATTLYFSSFSDQLARPLPGVRRRHGRTVRARGSVAGRRGREQRRLPAAVFPAARRAGPGRRAGRERRGGGRSPRGSRREVAFFGTETARAAARTRHRRRPHRSPTTCSRTCPSCTTSSQGLRILLKPEGVVTIEFPHLLRLIDAEPVRHDLPRALLVFLAARRGRALCPRHGMRIVDVEELWTHGGSLRIYVRHARRGGSPTDAVADVIARERAAGLDGLDDYRRFASAGRADEVRRCSRSSSRRHGAARRSLATARRPRATRS